MKTFVPGGPELPAELLQAQEEGRLAFFCGAGISYYTGLPGFAGFTEQTMAACAVPHDPAGATPLDVAFREGKYDRALHLLEIETPEMRLRAMDILDQPPQPGSEDLALHKALLNLARVDDGGHRLVTTNFDDRFERAAGRLSHVQAGPRLCSPRRELWRDLTYLHGRIDRQRDPEGRHLVLTSGDFGRAYLQEGWAARFVVELFRDFTVLFVGYSLNDPIVGYLVDALAAEGGDGGRFRNAYVLSDFSAARNDRSRREAEWRAKGVIPILYRKQRGKTPHGLLERTLKEWARHHEGGIGSRVSEALKIGRSPYLAGADEDLRNLTWALSKADGSVAKAFADADPPPDISWLEPLSRGYLPHAAGGEAVSLLGLPSPPGPDNQLLAPLAGPGAACIPGLRMAPITDHLGRWLTKHMRRLKVADWVIARKGLVHPQWSWVLEDELAKVGEPWATFWRLVIDRANGATCQRIPLSLRVAARHREWSPRLDWAVLAAAVPRLTVHETYRPADLRDEDVQDLRQIARFRVDVADGDFLVSLLHAHQERPAIGQALAGLVDRLTSRLDESLALGAEIAVREERGSALIENDYSNRRGIPLLARLCVVGLMHQAAADTAGARETATRWLALCRRHRALVLRRMAVLALAHVDGIPLEQELEPLLAEQAKVLWAAEAVDEVAEYLRRRAPRLSGESIERLVMALGTGPQRENYAHLSDDDFRQGARQHVGRRLRVLEDAGVSLPEDLRKLVAAEPLQRRPRMSGLIATREPEKADHLLSLQPAEVVARLGSVSDGFTLETMLQDYARRRPLRALRLLPLLVEQHGASPAIWPVLGALKDIKRPSARFVVTSHVLKMAREHPDWLERDTLQSLAWMLERFAPSVSDEGAARADYLALWRLTWERALADGRSSLGDDEETVDAAINAAGGPLADALVELALRGASIPPDLQPLLDEIASGDTLTQRYGRIRLASHLVWLHERATAWVRDTLIRRMEAGRREATGLWQGFFYGGRWSIPVMEDLRRPFLSLAPQISGSSLAEFWFGMLADILIEAPSLFSDQEVAAAFRHASGDDLALMARHLEGRLRETPALWSAAIKDILDKRWPSSASKRTDRASAALIDLAFAAGDAFPEAAHLLERRRLLGPVDDAAYFHFSLLQPDDERAVWVRQSPRAVLSILSSALPATLPESEKEDLGRVLAALRDADDGIQAEPRFRRLQALAGGPKE